MNTLRWLTMQIEAVEITLPSKGPWKVLVDAGSRREVNPFMLCMTIKLKFLR